MIAIVAGKGGRVVRGGGEVVVARLVVGGLGRGVWRVVGGLVMVEGKGRASRMAMMALVREMVRPTSGEEACRRCRGLR